MHACMRQVAGAWVACVPLLHLSLWIFQVFRAMTQAKVLMSRSWTKKKASSPHEPSGSWFLAIQSMHEGNSGPSPPSGFLTSAIHAVSYGETLISPPAADLNAALMVSIISSMCLGSPLSCCVFPTTGLCASACASFCSASTMNPSWDRWRRQRGAQLGRACWTCCVPAAHLRSNAALAGDAAATAEHCILSLSLSATH